MNAGERSLPDCMILEENSHGTFISHSQHTNTQTKLQCVKISQSHAQLTHFTERSTEQGKQAHFAQLPYKSRHSIKHLCATARSGTTAQPHGATRGSDAVGGLVGGASARRALQRTNTNLLVIKHTQKSESSDTGAPRTPAPAKQDSRHETQDENTFRRAPFRYNS